MRGKEMFEKITNIDDKIITETISASKKRKPVYPRYMKWASIAACFIFVIISVALWQQRQSTSLIPPSIDEVPPIVGDNTDDPTISMEYELHFNVADMTSSDRNIAIKGHFWNEMTSEQINKVIPIVSQKYDVTGMVHYSSENDVATLFQVDTSVIIDESINGRITISPNEIIRDYIIDGESILSEIEETSIEAGVFVTDKNSKNEQNYIYYADFKMDNTSYYVEFVSKNEKAEDIFTGLVTDIILGGNVDLSIFDDPVIPELIDEELSEQEAYNETDFGKYLFDIPNDYSFNNAYRWLNQNTNSLFASWSKGYNDVSISVYPNDEDSTSRIVSPEQTELYDMSLYPIPWADSMPSDTRQTIQNPVFRIEELTVDMIKMRGYTRNEVGDPSSDSISLRFSVLYDEVVVEVKSEDLSPEYLFDELTALNQE